MGVSFYQLALIIIGYFHYFCLTNGNLTMSSKHKNGAVPDLQTHHIALLYERTDKACEKNVAHFAGVATDTGLKIQVPNFGPDVFEDDKYVQYIKRFIKSSRRITLFLSKSYIESTQFDTDLSIIEDETVFRGREILTVVLCDDIEVSDLPDRITQGRALPVTGRSEQFHHISRDSWEDLITKLSEETPLLTTVCTGIGNGLGVSHFFGYLQFILPGLSERIEDEYKKSGSTWDCSSSATLYTKNIAITPIIPSAEKGMVWLNSLTDYDPRIVPVKSRSDGKPVKVMFEKDTPGHAGRPYPCTMWKANVDGKEYVFFAEIPNTLRTPFMLKSSGLAFDTDESLQRELWDFSRQLQGILTSFQDEYTASRINSIKFMEYDAIASGEDKLSDIIAKAINEDLNEEVKD